MSGPNKPYYFVDARPDDDKAILEILETPDFEGDLAVIYTRRPSPTQSFKRGGQQVRFLLCKARRDDELIGFGCCAINWHWVDGKPQKVAYFSGLRVKKAFRKTLSLLTDAYQALLSSAELDDIDYIYTTILKDNTAVQKMFEKRRRFFPQYIPIDNYSVLSIPIKNKRPDKRYIFETASAETLADYLKFYNDYAMHYDFSYRLEATDFSPKSALQLTCDNFFAVRDKQHGDILAVAYAWQQLDYKQHIIKHYGGIYQLIRPFSGLLPLFNYPKLPAVGSVLRYYNLSFWAYREQPALLSLMHHIANCKNDFDYYLVGLSKNHPFYQALSGLTKLAYDSKIYLIDTLKSDASRQNCLRHNKNHIECGLL